MCGITGWFSKNGSIDKVLFDSFRDTLTHRGPDSKGSFYCEKQKFALGHTRLAILDLSSSGNQPMVSLCGRYIIIFNGEIFNYLSVKKILLEKGYNFFSDTDTEVVLNAFIEFGSSCVSMFNGMWAFVVFDKKNETLFGSRDRFGIKPLYFYHDNKDFIFSSETISFKLFPHTREELNNFGIQNELKTQVYLEGNSETIFRNINALPPGHNFLIGFNNKLKVWRWWSVEDNINNYEKTFDTAVFEFKELFFDSLRLRYRSDVPVAAALSGGLDSSAIVSSIIALKTNGELNSNQKFKAFIASFPSYDNDEFSYAKNLVDTLQMPYSKILPEDTNSKFVDDFIKVTKAVDGITGTPLLSISNIYRQMRNEGVFVSLDGHGADELLFGYTWMVLQVQHYFATKGDYLQAQSLSDVYLNMFSEEGQVIAKGDLFPNLGFKRFYYKIKNKLRTKEFDHWLGISLKPKDKFKHPNGISIDNVSHTFLPSILRNFDRASMIHGVEVRMPFLDYRLASFLISLPIEFKLGNGFTKLILRQALKNQIPDLILNRTWKLGINSPVFEWFNGPLNGLVLDIINSKSFQESHLFDGKCIRKDVENSLMSKDLNKINSTRLWPYINFDIINEL
jgi:asparagine synthase (glutamine-hydrolysing)